MLVYEFEIQYPYGIMERQEIIKKFLSNGYILEESALDMLVKDSNLVDLTLSYLSSRSTQHTITVELLRPLLGTIRVIKSFRSTHSKTTPSDVTKMLHERYEKMREIISKQLAPESIISINKISTKNRNFTLVAIVREKEGNRLVVEDGTGEAIVNVEHEKSKFIVEDEVVGFVCEQDQKITAKQIVWPDIPLGRTINKSEEEIICIFTKDTPQTDYTKLEKLCKDKNSYIFVFGDPKPANDRIFFIAQQQNLDAFSDPSLVGIRNIKVLLSSGVEKYTKLWNISPEVAQQNLLKKRHLDPKLGPDNISAEDMFFIDDIPDVIVSPTSGESIPVNYKGTTLISTSYPVCMAVNLKTRETFKIEVA